jgi:hypothetical protein
MCPTVARHGKDTNMDTIKLSIRLSQDVYDMLNALEKKQTGDNKKQHLPDTSKTDIIKNALREYYARHMDQSTENAYMELVSSTLNNLLVPYFNSLISAVQKLTNSNTKVNESVKLETLMNRMCFNLLFRSDELPEDEELLYKVLIKRTPFDDVLERVAKEKDTYNSVPEEADGSK